MSISTLPTTGVIPNSTALLFGPSNSPPYLGRIEGEDVPALLQSESIVPQSFNVASFTVASTGVEIESRGWLEIPGARFEMPEQRFLCSVNDQSLRFENLPDSSWPRISVELVAASPTSALEVESFRVRPSENSADGEILYSRVQYLISALGQCLLHIDGVDTPIRFSFDQVSEGDKQKLLYRAKIFRKLKFIEWVFKTRFALPTEIPSDDVWAIDFIFRGITEGEFITRQQEITLPFDSSKVDLNRPPFNGTGELSYRNTDEVCELFDHRLSIGPVLVHLEQAEIASPQAIRELRVGQPGPVRTRFSILDHQIQFSFERKLGTPRKQLKRKLESFKRELAKDDPPELVTLLDEPLISDVAADEANLIAVGWTQYNNLPDRYCTQEPVLDTSANAWRVPITFGYPTGQSGVVGELLIDAKTGKIVSHTPLEELRNQGKSLAKAFLHAS